ncbi:MULTISPECIES: hypothetical protein [Burkholderia]|nr:MULTISPECIES: hypothetical protein [Burkholderia]MCA8478662.1 hypothetical protein [Burkholderia multivorans]
MQTTHARTPGSASTRRIAHRDAATRPGTSRGYPQILLASLWIGCAYDAQAFDRKRFVRVAENASRGSYVTPPGGDRRGRAPRACPQILLASVWIACAYRAQALDPKRLIRIAANAATHRLAGARDASSCAFPHFLLARMWIG